jgi:hypothetical protein
MLRYFSNGIPRSSVSSPLAARITRVRGARPAVFCKDGKNRASHNTGSVTPSVAIHASHALIRPRTMRDADEATTKRRKRRDYFFIHLPPPRLPLRVLARPSFAPRPRARAQGIKGCATRPGNRFIPLDANALARTRRVPTSSHEFRDTHERVHPTRRSPVSTLASRRVASRPSSSPASPPPTSRPRSPPRVVTRPPTTPPTTFGDARRERARVKNTSSPFRAHTTHRSSRATGRGRRHGRGRHRPHHRHRPRRVRGIESSRRRVTSRRGVTARPVDDRWFFLFFFDSIFLLIGFGVCPLRTYVVSCIHDES